VRVRSAVGGTRTRSRGRDVGTPSPIGTVRARSLRGFAIVALALAVGLASAGSPFASAAPDGLNRVAADKGFGNRGTLHAVQEHSPIPGYALPGVQDEKLAKGLAGFAGTLLVLGAGLGLAYVLRRSRRARPRAPAAT